MNVRNLIYILTILAIVFTLGYCTGKSQTDITRKIKIIIPEQKGSTPNLIIPDPIVTTKDSLIYKDSLIITENPFNHELAERYNKLESEYEKTKAYINSIQIRKYKVPFENDTIKIVGDVEVQGELKSLKYDWTIKERKLNIPVEIKKPAMNLLIGGTVLNTVTLDKFNFNTTLGIQRKNGDLILGSYGVFDKSIQIGYLVNLKL